MARHQGRRIEEKVLKNKKVVKMSIRRNFFKSNSQEGSWMRAQGTGVGWTDLGWVTVLFRKSIFPAWSLSLDGLRFELFSQKLVNKLLHNGRRYLFHITNVLGTGRHVQDGEQGGGLREVGVISQRVAHVVLQWGKRKILHHVAGVY